MTHTDKEPRRDIDIDAANEVFSLRDTEFIPNKREVCREQPIKEKYEICQKFAKNSTVRSFLFTGSQNHNPLLRRQALSFGVIRVREIVAQSLHILSHYVMCFA